MSDRFDARRKVAFWSTGDRPAAAGQIAGEKRLQTDSIFYRR